MPRRNNRREISTGPGAQAPFAYIPPPLAASGVIASYIGGSGWRGVGMSRRRRKQHQGAA